VSIGTPYEVHHQEWDGGSEYADTYPLFATDGGDGSGVPGNTVKGVSIHITSPNDTAKRQFNALVEVQYLPLAAASTMEAPDYQPMLTGDITPTLTEHGDVPPSIDGDTVTFDGANYLAGDDSGIATGNAARTISFDVNVTSMAGTQVPLWYGVNSSQQSVAFIINSDGGGMIYATNLDGEIHTPFSTGLHSVQLMIVPGIGTAGTWTLTVDGGTPVVGSLTTITTSAGVSGLLVGSSPGGGAYLTGTVGNVKIANSVVS
jgi:hypothetical protein